MGCLRETGHQEAGITYQLASWFTDDTWNRSAKPRIIENFPIDMHETESLEEEPRDRSISRLARIRLGTERWKRREIAKTSSGLRGRRIRTKRRGSVGDEASDG